MELVAYVASLELVGGDGVKKKHLKSSQPRSISK